ncbi:MAG TPA: hypothetical protein VKO83_06460 [Steroidobacteraceae bacterium]|nr:hypothetical protein [Steroidobacteraceae bacterium]
MNTTHEIFPDFRARAERAAREAAERREQALVDQRSPDNTKEARVRIWERLHQVRLPKDPAHPILALIAKQTGLNLADVREVQSSRVAPAA